MLLAPPDTHALQSSPPAVLPQPPPARPHLVPALAAILLALAGLLVFARYAAGREARSLEALAPLAFDQKSQGSALQRAAFGRADLLPVYGASELLVYRGPFHAGQLFASYPTDFTIFPVGRDGATAMIVLQDLAALGGDVRGKRVAITLSPTTYFNRRDMLLADDYAGNFSRLHAAATLFGDDLSPGLKRDLARRMLRNPATLRPDPLLTFAAERLAADTWPDLLLYRLAQPLGRLSVVVLELQDDWETLAFIAAQSGLPNPPRRPATLDWPSLAASAEAEYRQQASGNPFGFDDQVWQANQARLTQQSETRTDAGFQAALQQASEWTDVELLLRALKELGAEPLILSQPIKGVYYDFQGVSARARGGYYRRLEELCAAYGVPLLDFADHDEDPWFLRDPGAHISPKGWVYFAQALDAFYRGGGAALPRP